MNSKRIGYICNKYRQSCGLTAKEFLPLMNMKTTTQLSQFEMGTSCPNVYVERLAEVMDIPEWVFAYEFGEYPMDTQVKIMLFDRLFTPPENNKIIQSYHD